MDRTHFVVVIGAALALASCASTTGPGSGHGQAGPLLEEVRRATARFQDVSAATAAGYALFLGCVSSPQDGAMGVHYVNGDVVNDGEIDAARPEAVIYEPTLDGLRLVGVEYVVIASAWDAKHKTPPTLMGQVFHYTSAPNRYGLPAFYGLHVWAWRENPNGPFADWNPTVSCREYRARGVSPSGPRSPMAS